MFLQFFYLLRQHGLPVSLHEYLTLMEALQKKVIPYSIDAFYALSKSIFVKQEGHLDRFDLLFAKHFQDIQHFPDEILQAQIPPEWIQQDILNQLSDEEREQIKKYGGLDGLLEHFKKILEEQKEIHSGGSKWIGQGGTSPFGNSGYHPEGFRIGGEGGNRGALKVWERRDFRNLDDQMELNTRNLKMILKRLRVLTREGIPTELDLDKTIQKTSENAGMLEISMQAAKKNRVKVVMLMDVGGSMNMHVDLCEQLFSAARWEFKYLEFFYFHNCVYERVWKDNKRRWAEFEPTLSLLHKYHKDYKLIFVGDAAMSVYELYYRGGSVEHYNDEPGLTWLQRLHDHFSHLIWINPLPEYEWDYYESVQIIRKAVNFRMFPMTMDGLTKAMKCLKNPQKSYQNQVWEDES